MGTLRLAGSLEDGVMRMIAQNDIDGRKTLNIKGDLSLIHIYVSYHLPFLPPRKMP